MKNYITETWLREHGALADGVCLRLPPGSLLTPAAQSLVAERRLRISYGEEDSGNTPPAAVDSVDSAARPRVHPLTGKERGTRPPAAHCALCRQEVGKKPDALTHLNADVVVPKNDVRIRFRGRLDSAIACAVWLQAEWEEERRVRSGEEDALFARLEQGLADVRSALGGVLRAEVSGEALPPPRLGPFDEEAIHRVSHDPWRYLGHDHVVPEVSQGVFAARLNLLRATIREAEACAAEVHVGRDFEVARPDIMLGLNRLSSAVYILMILAIMRERRVPLKEGAWN
jgi:ethanolamine utilization cobalamin adenosyltransferase